MTVGLKTDPQVVAAVVGLKLKEPRVSYPEIERRGIAPKSTACDIIHAYLGNIGTEDDLVKAIIAKDLENVALGQIAISNTISKNIDRMETKELSAMASVMGDATKRRQLMTGGATENVAVGISTFLPEKED